MSNALDRVIPWRRISAAASASWVARTGSAPELRPLSLAGTPRGGVLTAGSILAIIAITAVETGRPGMASIGALLFIPVIAAAWLVDAPQALVVSALGVSARIIGYSAAGVDLTTAVAEVISLMALGTMTRIAAVGLVEGRERRLRAAREKQALELLALRDRIAVDVTNTAIRSLFAVTLDLEGVALRSGDPAVKPALDRVIAEVDDLITEFRRLVFHDGPGPAEPDPATATVEEPAAGRAAVLTRTG